MEALDESNAVSVVVEAQEPVAVAVRPRLRWRLFPAAFLMIFGVLGVLLVATILAALLFDQGSAVKRFFDGPNSPELSPKSLGGMACCTGFGLAWVGAGWLIWRKKHVAGLLVAAISYPIGTYGADWMFSSSMSPPVNEPNLVAPPVQQPRFDDRRRRPPPMPLAKADLSNWDDGALG